MQTNVILIQHLNSSFISVYAIFSPTLCLFASVSLCNGQSHLFPIIHIFIHYFTRPFFYIKGKHLSQQSNKKVLYFLFYMQCRYAFIISSIKNFFIRCIYNGNTRFMLQLLKMPDLCSTQFE